MVRAMVKGSRSISKEEETQTNIFLHTVVAHLRPFFETVGSFVRTISPGKRIQMHAKFPQVNVTFALISFSHVSKERVRFSSGIGMASFGEIVSPLV